MKKGKCSTEKNCEALDLAIQSKVIGAALMLNMTTGKGHSALTVLVKRPGDKKRQLVLNYCPWCRADLNKLRENP